MNAQARLFLRGTLLSVTALILVTYAFGPLKKAGWALIDDHEIAHFTGSSGRLPFAEIPRTLLDTEVGYAGQVPRFRPAYYGLRLLETSFWGFEPAPWYRARRAMYGLTFVLVGWVLTGLIGIVATIGLLVWVLSGAYWWDVWRLGAGESYSAIGCALWLVGIKLLWSSSRLEGRLPWWRQGLGFLLFIFGSVIAMSAKETLLILAAPNLLLLIRETRARRTGGIRWWASLAGVTAAVAVAGPLVMYFLARPIDQYGRSVSVAARLAVLAMEGARPTAVHAAFVLAVILWGATSLAARLGAVHPSSAWRQLTHSLVFVSASALALYVSQIVLYNGDITPGTRYEFPAALAGPAVLVAASLCLRTFFRQARVPGAERVVYHATAIVLVGLAVVSAGGFRKQRQLSEGHARATREFTAQIKAAAAVARAAPDVPIVVTSGRPLDVEPIFSVERFLRALGALNPRFLVLDWESGRSQWSLLDTYLAPGLEHLARNGGHGYEPVARLDPKAPCFGVGLGREPPRGCTNLGRP